MMIKPMLLTEVDKPFDDPAYCWQLKLDGIRCIAVQEGAQVRPGPSLALVESWPGTQGTAAAQAVAARDLEGIVAKRLDSHYQLEQRKMCEEPCGSNRLDKRCRMHR